MADADFDVDELLNQQLEEQKHVTNENERSGRDRDDSSRHKSRERSSERERGRSRDSHREHERGDRHRDDRHRSDRHSDRDRDRDRDRGRDRYRDDRDRHRDRDRYEDRSERRGRDRDGRERESKERDRGDRDRRGSDRDRRSSDRDRERRSSDRSAVGGRNSEAALPPPPRRPRTPTPERELRNMQRMACTVMAYGLSVLAEEMDIFEFFSAAGDLVDVKVIRDRHSTRHKGIAYIEYKDRADVQNALQLNGQKLKGMPVNVKPSEAEKNFAWESAELQKRQTRMMTDPATAGIEAGGPTRLKVENIPAFGLEESDVKEVFVQFGTVMSLTFERDAGGAFTGVAYVQYPTAPEARKAVLALDGSSDLGGPPLRLTTVEVPSAYQGFAAGAMGAAGEIDEGDEAGGLRLNASARTALMGRMSGAAGIERPKEPALPPPPPGPPAAPAIRVDAAVEADKGLVGQPSPRPTPCLLLKNMFDPAAESGTEWPREIEEDTRGECSKFGPVVHVHVDPRSKGFVYLKFADERAAGAALQALHGRWYSNNQIVASFQIPQLYDRAFGLSG